MIQSSDPTETAMRRLTFLLWLVVGLSICHVIVFYVALSVFAFGSP